MCIFSCQLEQRRILNVSSNDVCGYTGRAPSFLNPRDDRDIPRSSWCRSCERVWLSRIRWPLEEKRNAAIVSGILVQTMFDGIKIVQELFGLFQGKRSDATLV
jgi:hypothetical protein